jgi:predicted amidohydrolase
VSTELKVAVGQFVATGDWRENLETCADLVRKAEAESARLLVLPEGVLARFVEDRDRIREVAQPLDGPFVTGLAQVTEGLGVTVVVGIHERGDAGDPDGKPFNTLVVLRGGSVVATYRKLHLYDAFSMRESDNVTAADSVPGLVDVDGFKVGLMTCYDVRFPELARLLALAGADVFVLPAAWVKGPLKEHHWRTLVTARALDNTVYVGASGESGPRNIGQSLVVDPLGVTIAQAAEEPALITTVLTARRLAEARDRLPVLANRRFDVDPRPRPIAVPPPSAHSGA